MSPPNCAGLALPRPVMDPVSPPLPGSAPRSLVWGLRCSFTRWPSPLLTPGPDPHHAVPTLAGWAITPSSARMVGQVQQTQDNGAWMLDRGFAGIFAVGAVLRAEGSAGAPRGQVGGGG